jgi:hypothetical protein
MDWSCRRLRKVNMPRWCRLIWLFSLASALPSAAWSQSEQGVVPAGWHTYGPGFARASAAAVNAPTVSGPVNTVYEQLPDDTGWLYDQTPLERILKDTFRHAYFRLEYLNWDITDPGNNTLSGPTNYPTFQYPPDLVRSPTNPNLFVPTSIFSDGADPTPTTTTTPQTFPVNDVNGGAERSSLPPVYHISNPSFVIDPSALPPMYIATQPTTEGVMTNKNNGIRGTFGFVLPVGEFQTSVFALAPATTRFAPQQILFLDVADIDDDDGDLVMGDGDTTEYLPTFDAIAQAMLIDGQIPSVPITVTLGEQQSAQNPQLPIPSDPNNPLVPNPPLNEPISRGDNFLIVYNPVLDPVTGDLVTNPTSGHYNPLTGNRLVPVYQASLKSQMWGAESNYLAPALDQGSPMQLQPLIGFRFVNFQEDLRQSGLYTFTSQDPNTGVFTNSIESRKIDSTTVNNLYGPQIGFRAEMSHKWLSIGAQPKVMLGLNSYKANLQTQNILRPDDVDQSLQENNQTFGVVSDLQVYSRLNLTSHFSVFAAYNFLWTGSLTRPTDNIVYNARTLQSVLDRDQTVPNPLPNFAVTSADVESDFKLDPTYTSLIMQGVSVGGEVRW